MSIPIVFMFSGQGSQYYQMGRELYDNQPRFRLWMDHCDSIVRSLMDISIIDEIYHNHPKSDTFDRLLYTNPALLCIEYSLARMLMEMNVKPDYLLGYSLGEITASVVSGSVSLEDGIRIVVDAARLIESRSPPAGMLAVIANESIMLDFPGLFEGCYLSGRNFHNNFVVSGLIEDINRLQTALKKQGVLTQRLAVGYGFHTPLMDALEISIESIVGDVNFSSIKIPVISALHSNIVKEFNSRFFWEILRYPVEFSRTISRLLKKDNYLFIDVGPSGTLATSVRYLMEGESDSSAMEIMNQFGKDLKSLDKFKAEMLNSNETA